MMNDETTTMASEPETDTTSIPQALEASAAQAWTVWTDGSCVGNPGPAGWAVLVETPEGDRWTLHGSSKNTTNVRAEMYGFLQGLRAVPLNTPAVIRTDHSNNRDGCYKWRQGWQAKGMWTKGGPVKNADLWLEVWAALDARPLVRIEWVRGHDGEQGNEIVDRLAQAAARRRKAGGKAEHLVRTDQPPVGRNSAAERTLP